MRVRICAAASKYGTVPRRSASQRPLNGSITKLKARMSESSDEAVIKSVERVLQSRTRVARSKKFLAKLEAAKRGR
jgi:hypothetical protein